MPPKQKNSTPIKPPEGSTMTHESEDIQNEISKLEKRLDELEGLMIKKRRLGKFTKEHWRKCGKNDGKNGKFTEDHGRKNGKFTKEHGKFTKEHGR